MADDMMIIRSCDPSVRSVQTVAMTPPISLFRGGELRVLLFRLNEDGDVGVCVLPRRQEILIRLLRFADVAGKRVGSRQAKVGQRIKRREAGHSVMIDNSLKLER